MGDNRNNNKPLKEDYVIIPNKQDYEICERQIIRETQESVINIITRPDTGDTKPQK